MPPKKDEPPPPVEPETPPEPVVGSGKFYYIDGATYEGDWLQPDPPKPEAPPGAWGALEGGDPVGRGGYQI